MRELIASISPPTSLLFYSLSPFIASKPTPPQQNTPPKMANSMLQEHMGRHIPKSFSQIVRSASSWVGAAAVGYYLFRWNMPARRVTAKDAGAIDGPEFELYQARVNSQVKENDRNQNPNHVRLLENMQQAARLQTGELDPQIDFMSPLMNSVDEEGNLVAVERPDARVLRQWMDKKDIQDYSQEVEHRRKAKAEYLATNPR